jgi:hypothetical protein
MASKSKSQQRLMGMAYAYSKGEMKDASPSVKKLAKSFMKKGKKKGTKSLKDFAKTKHIGLPEKVKESMNHLVRFSEFKSSY